MSEFKAGEVIINSATYGKTFVGGNGGGGMGELETPKIVGIAYSQSLCSLTGCGYEGEGELGLFLCSRHRKMIIREALATQRADLAEKVRGLRVTTMWGYGYALQRDEVLALIEGEK